MNAGQDLWTLRRRLAAGAMLVTIVAASCSSGKGKTAPPSSTTSTASVTVEPTTSTTSQAGVESVILSQWQAAQRASLMAAEDPGSQGLILALGDYFVDPALASLRSTYAAYVRDGLTSVGDIDPGEPSVVNMTETTATVRSCATNRLALVNAATGKPLPGAVGSTAPVQNGVRSIMLLSPSGSWKVSMTTVKDGTCVGI